MNPVSIIGIGMSPEDLTARQLEIINQADILVGGKRLLAHFKQSRARKKSIGKDITGIVEFVRQEMKLICRSSALVRLCLDMLARCGGMQEFQMDLQLEWGDDVANLQKRIGRAGVDAQRVAPAERHVYCCCPI